MSLPPRTNPSAVQAILGGTTPNSNWDGLTDLSPFIRAASIIIDRVKVAAQGKPWVRGGVRLTAVELKEMETWLAAHFYLIRDPLYQSKSVGGASGTFQRKQGDGFETTDYGRAACNIDFSGTLRAIGLRQFAGAAWLGINMAGEFNPPNNPPDSATSCEEGTGTGPTSLAIW